MNPQDQSDDTQQNQAQSGGAAQPDDLPNDQIVNQSDPSMTEISLPTEAEDLDLIEKEWVDRAKQIVAHTHDNPYEQQRALSEMKADYLKKRYGKDIKLHES